MLFRSKTSFCGKIDSAADVDYASFVVPMGAKTIDVKHSEKNGKAVYRYFLGGASFGSDPVQPGTSQTLQSEDITDTLFDPSCGLSME